MGDATPLLSHRSIEAIAEIATSEENVKLACESVGLQYRRYVPEPIPGVIYVPGPREHLRATLEAADLTNPEVVSRVLRAVSQLVKLYRASRDCDEEKLVRLQMVLEADGFHMDASGSPVTALGDLAVAATTTLAEVSGIRAELLRLQNAIDNDPSVTIGKAKNLVEATAKAILSQTGGTAGKDDSLTALARRAAEALNVHPQGAGDRKHVRNLLGRLSGMVDDLMQLRNEVGDGHGAAVAPTDIDRRHGRIAAWAAIAWCSFMLDTLTQSKTQPKERPASAS